MKYTRNLATAGALLLAMYKFDASGNATECGAATVNNATGEIDMVVAKASK